MRLHSCLVLLMCLSHSQGFQCSTSPYTSQIPEYTVCTPENGGESHLNDASHTEDCDFVSTILINECSTEDRPIPAQLCWRLRDPEQGIVEVTYPLLPASCNFTAYDITLMAHEGMECPAFTDNFKKHTRREVDIRGCSEASCKDKCSQRGTVMFRHVFTGCYQLCLTPRRHYQALQELVSSPLALATNYVKTPISTLQDPLFFLDMTQSSLTMKAQLRINPMVAIVTLSHGINMAAGPHACRDTGIPIANCATCLGSPEIQCSSESRDSVIPTCSYQGESVVKCRFSGLKPGNYCVRVQFDDDRCVADTIWNDDNNYSPCTWETFRKFVTAEPAIEVDIRPQGSIINPMLLALLVLAIVAACLVVTLVVYRRTPNYGRFLPVPRKPIQLAERPTVLLLYARDCPLFMQAVAHLKTVMKRLNNCQVMDCWEDSQYDSVAKSPSQWLLSYLTNPKVRVVLVISPTSALLEAALVHRVFVQYRQRRALDCVFAQALSSLHETSHDSYKRLFVVRLDTESAGVVPQTRTYLNPLATYILPVNLNKLMTTLHNLDSTVVAVEDSQPEVVALSDAISEYRRYLSENPRYLDNLLTSDTVPSVHQIMA
uniref:SEFIR domain-containing protein n=1 Tax=Homalodisca liturata TaxID=320908 RepID=A0A1B6I733_9HEMI